MTDFNNDLEIESDDYAFVIAPDGSLKSIQMPYMLEEELPEEVRLILKLFGLSDIDFLEGRTLH